MRDGFAKVMPVWRAANGGDLARLAYSILANGLANLRSNVWQDFVQCLDLWSCRNAESKLGPSGCEVPFSRRDLSP